MPLDLLLKPLRPFGLWCLSQPWLAGPLKRLLRRFPVLFVRLRQAVLHSSTESSAARIISFETFNLVFASGPLQDKRGIGRVSHALYEALRQDAELRLRNHPQAFAERKVRPHIHFFSAIQWCPEILPSRSIVMVHDVTPLVLPDDFPLASRQEWAQRLRPIAHQASLLVSISKSSAQDIELHLGLPKGAVRVVYNGIQALPSPRTLGALEAFIPKAPYLVFVGSHDHHKNLDVVLQALLDPRLSDLHLVWVGDAHSISVNPVPEALGPRVHLLGRLADEQLAAVLARAWLLAFPSLYEGFGLPPFEAALLGVPSICSARPAMTELLQGAAWFVPAEDPRAWADQLLAIQASPAERDAMAQRARAVAEQYEWAGVVNRLLPLAENLATEGLEDPVELQA